MLIEKLNLIAFGKFNKKEVQLKKGINIIYGENEAGKSTLHSFIDGIFYGFLRPNVKSTRYTEDHDKYKPWDSSRYAGSLSFTYEDKLYEIEREFTRGEETTKIINGLTGEDISGKIEVGRGKVLQPGLHFFNFNSRVFSNTILIKQVSSKTEKELANEIREKLINRSSSMDDNISIEKSLANLKGQMGEIGTDKASTKPYAKNLAHLESLYREKEAIDSEKETYDSYIEERDRLILDLEKEEDNFKKLESSFEKLEILKKVRRLEEAKIVQDEIDILGKKITRLEAFSRLSMEDYKNSISLSNSLEYLEKDLGEKILDLDRTRDKIADLSEEEKNSQEESKDLSNDFGQYEKIEEEKNRLLFSKEDTSLEFLKRDFDQAKDKLSKGKKLYLLPGIFFLLGIFLLLSLKENYLPAISLFLLGLGSLAYIAFSLKKEGKQIQALEEKLKDLEKQENNKKEEISRLERSMEEILTSYNMASKLDLKRLLDSSLMEDLRRKDKLNLLGDLRSKLSSLEGKIQDFKSDQEAKRTKLELIFASNQVKSIEEFNQALEKKASYEKYISHQDQKKEILGRILGPSSLEDLEKELDKKTIDLSIQAMDENVLATDIVRSRENISDFKIAIKGAEENISILSKRREDLVEIEEEISRKLSYKLELEQEYEALNLAHDTIESLSKEIHSDFAPDINKSISNTIDRITGGKYNRVRLDEDLNISVENPATRENINLESLSGGTMDQLYFSLRFSITNSLEYNKLPLIMDDCFIQYDDKRLKNIMKFLFDLSRSRQLILFTCQNREAQALKTLGLDYNLINLA